MTNTASLDYGLLRTINYCTRASHLLISRRHLPQLNVIHALTMALHRIFNVHICSQGLATSYPWLPPGTPPLVVGRVGQAMGEAAVTR